MSADRPRKEKSFYRDNQIGFQFNHICIVLKQITQQIHTLQVCVNFGALYTKGLISDLP